MDKLKVVGLIVVFAGIYAACIYGNIWWAKWASGSSDLEKRIVKLEQRVDALEKNKAIDLGNVVGNLLNGGK